MQLHVVRSELLRTGEDPQMFLRQLEPARGAVGRLAVTAQTQCAELEKVFAPIAEKHVGDELGSHTVIALTVGNASALETDDTGGDVAGLEVSPSRTPQSPAVSFQHRPTANNLRD